MQRRRVGLLLGVCFGKRIALWNFPPSNRDRITALVMPYAPPSSLGFPPIPLTRWMMMQATDFFTLSSPSPSPPSLFCPTPHANISNQLVFHVAPNPTSTRRRSRPRCQRSHHDENMHRCATWRAT